MAPDAASRRCLLDQIESLVVAPSGAAQLSDLEHTLADGYAHALALEAERLRLEKRLGTAAASLASDASHERVDEVSRLARRLRSAEQSLDELRRALGTLRARAAELRAA